MIIYSKKLEASPSAIDRLETPIKMIIEHESDLAKKRGGVCDWLFNVEKSNRFGETIINQTGFDIFKVTEEGSAAEQDIPFDTYKKFVEHIQFMKEFIVSAEMMEDANYGIASDAKRRAENFVRAYYKTVNKICEQALINGTQATMTFGGSEIDITGPDESSVFNAYHRWGSEFSPSRNCGVQSNHFYGQLFGENDIPTTEAFEEILTECAYKIRSMKDENGEAMGYAADTIILPGNKPKLEAVVKKVCGSLGALGGTYNDINLHYGNWNVIVLPGWISTENSFMVMSSDANKSLAGNMFFNRVPLTVTNWVDHHTGNYIWNGRCRFGVGFGSYKHIIRVVSTTNPPHSSTAF